MESEMSAPAELAFRYLHKIYTQKDEYKAKGGLHMWVNLSVQAEASARQLGVPEYKILETSLLFTDPRDKQLILEVAIETHPQLYTKEQINYLKQKIELDL